MCVCVTRLIRSYPNCLAFVHKRTVPCTRRWCGKSDRGKPSFQNVKHARNAVTACVSLWV